MSPETVYKEFSLRENSKAKELRDTEAVKLKKDGYSVQTYFTVKADKKSAETFYSLLATKKEKKARRRKCKKTK